MIPYFDAHCDTLTAVYERGGSLWENGLMLDVRRLGAYAPAAQFFAVWNGHYPEKAALLRAEAEKHPDGLTLCRSAAQAREAVAAGQVAALLSVEGMEQLACSVDRLRLARERDGVLMVNLCWNQDNALCADCPRNLTDAQFTALVQAGGGAGINLCPDFLGLSRDSAAVCAHIEHFLALGGERAVFLGCDLDGIDDTPRDIAGAEHMGHLYEALLRRNLPESLVRDIFYNNLMDILERTA